MSGVLKDVVTTMRSIQSTQQNVMTAMQSVQKSIERRQDGEARQGRDDTNDNHPHSQAANSGANMHVQNDHRNYNASGDDHNACPYPELRGNREREGQRNTDHHHPSRNSSPRNRYQPWTDRRPRGYPMDGSDFHDYGEHYRRQRHQHAMRT